MFKKKFQFCLIQIKKLPIYNLFKKHLLITKNNPT